MSTDILISDVSLYNELVRLNIVVHHEKRLVKTSKLKKIKTLKLCGINIKSFPEIKHLTSLERLDISSNQLEEINLSDNTKLKHLRIDRNKLTKLNLSNLKSLIYLSAEENQISDISFHFQSKLIDLRVGKNHISKIDLSGCRSLRSIQINNNKISNLDIRNNQLIFLNCSNNQIKELNLSKLKYLEFLSICNNDTEQIRLPKGNLNSIHFHNNQNIKNIIQNWVWSEKSDEIDIDEFSEDICEFNYDHYFSRQLNKISDSDFSSWDHMILEICIFLKYYDKAFNYHRVEKGNVILDKIIIFAFNVQLISASLEIDINHIYKTKSGYFLEDISRYFEFTDKYDHLFPSLISVFKDGTAAQYELQEGNFLKTNSNLIKGVYDLQTMYYTYRKSNNTISEFPEIFILVND